MSLMQMVVDELVENETVDALTFQKLVLHNSLDPGLDPKQAVATLYSREARTFRKVGDP